MNSIRKKYKCQICKDKKPSDNSIKINEDSTIYDYYIDNKTEMLWRFLICSNCGKRITECW